MQGITIVPAPAAPAPVAAPSVVAGPCVADAPLSLPTRSVKSPLATSGSDDLKKALALVTNVVQTYALDPEDPWAVGHGILALGPDVVLTNGKPAVDWLFAEYATIESVAGVEGVAFPQKRGAIRIEPHTDLLLKAFTEGGVDPARNVTVGGQPHTVEQLYRRSLCAAWVSGQSVSFDNWNDTPWALQALSTWAGPGTAWTADGGHPMTMDGFTNQTVARLHAETAVLRAAKASGEAVSKVELKRQQDGGILGYTCGGAHLVQGAAWSVGRGFGAPEDRAAIAEQVSLYLWRMDLELDAVNDTVIAQNPTYAAKLLNQRLKYLGHLLETVHKAAAVGLFSPTDAEKAKIEEAAHALAAVVLEVEKRGFLRDLPAIKKADYQTYLDYVGDSAHAKRGIDLHMGVGEVRY